MGQLISLAVVWLLIAALIGWWPFDDSVLQTMSGECTYEAGYQDGWDGAKVAFENTDYVAGYDGGTWEGDCHYAKCVKRDRDLFEGYRCGNWRDHTC